MREMLENVKELKVREMRKTLLSILVWLGPLSIGLKVRTVSTRDQDYGFKILNLSMKDPEDGAEDWTYDLGMANLTKMSKNVGNGTANNTNGGFKVELKNANLGYYNEMSFNLRNNGIEPFEIDNVIAGDKEFTAQDKVLKLGINEIDENNLELEWNGPTEETLQGDETVDISVGLHVLSGSSEHASLDFLIKAEMFGDNLDGTVNSTGKPNGTATLSVSSEARNIFRNLNPASSTNGEGDEKSSWSLFMVGLVPAMIGTQALFFICNQSEGSEEKSSISQKFFSEGFSPLLKSYIEDFGRC